MTKGVLIFAQNNSEIDYVKLAVFAANRVKKYLDVPVSIVTDKGTPVPSDIFDQVLFIDEPAYFTKHFYDGVDKSTSLEWKNTARSNCFYLSPYDETLVIDADYVVNSDILSHCWKQPLDFLIYKDAVDLSSWRNTKEFEYVSDFSVPFYWATVFFFRKNNLTEGFFNLVDHIKLNWGYYKFLHQIHSTNFRNDLAFSIALHMLNGSSTGFFAGALPGKLCYTHGQDLLLQIDNESMKFLIQSNTAAGGYIHSKTTGLDVHVMNKYSLMRCIDNE